MRFKWHLGWLKILRGQLSLVVFHVSLPSLKYHSYFKMDTFLFKQILAYKYFLLAASTLSPTTIVSRVTSSPVLTTEFTNITSQQNDTIIRTKPTLFDRKITHFVYLVALLNVRMKLCDEEIFHVYKSLSFLDKLNRIVFLINSVTLAAFISACFCWGI